MSEEIFLAGVGMTPFGVFLDRSVKSLAKEAIEEALSDAGAGIEDIDAAFFGNAMQDILEGQSAISGQIALRSMGFAKIPMFNVENACATGATAVHLASAYVRAGMADIVLAAGAEKMNFPDMSKTFRAFDGGVDVHAPQELDAILKELGGAEADGGTGHRSSFMEIYAAVARSHMRAFGTTQRQIAYVAAKNHHHSTLNPKAYFQKDMSVEQVLAGRPLGFPVTVPMCSPMTDGGAAALICNKRGLARLKNARPVRLLASVVSTGEVRPLSDWDRSITRRASQLAYKQAGIGPSDISVAEVHDASAFGELSQSELLGFCDIGAGGKLAESGATSLGGRIPINPSGGLESKGHPIGATGIAQLYELVTQLRGDAGARQVSGARFALAENGGGMIGGEEAVASIIILGS